MRKLKDQYPAAESLKHNILIMRNHLLPELENRQHFYLMLRQT